jgi:hypothetical protein
MSSKEVSMKMFVLGLLAAALVTAFCAGVTRADPINVSKSRESSLRPRIIYDDIDQCLHVFWLEETNLTQVRHRQIFPDSLGPVELISDTSTAAGNLDSYTDLEGNSYIAWTETKDISEGMVVSKYHGGWLERHQLPLAILPVVDLAVACSPGGAIRLGWLSERDEDISVWYAEYDDIWEFENLTTYHDQDYPQEAPPQVGLGLGDGQCPVLVWLLMSFEFPQDSVGVFFSIKQNGEWSEAGKIGYQMAPLKLSVTDDGRGTTFVVTVEDFFT